MIEAQKGKKWVKRAPQWPDIPLDAKWVEQISVSWKVLKKLWINSNNVIIKYSDDTQRVIESVNILCNELFECDYTHCINNELVSIDWRLSTTEKIILSDWSTSHSKDEERILKDTEIFRNTVQLMQKIRADELFLNKSDFNIILVWHKSNKSWFVEAIQNKNKWLRFKNDMSPWEILEVDINSNLDYIDEKKGRLLLILNNKNFENITWLLWKIKKLEGVIEMFEKWEMQIWKLQNNINLVFAYEYSKWNNMYKNLLLIHNLELVIFALRNLFEKSEIDIIKKNIPNIFKNDTRQKLKLIDVFHEYKQKEWFVDCYDLFLKDLNDNEIINRVTVKNCKKSWNLATHINYYENIYKQISETRQKSLNPRIRYFKTYWVQFNLDNQAYRENILSLISDWNRLKLIEWCSWSGKSLLLCHINERLKETNFNLWDRYIFPISITLTWKTFETLKEEIDTIISQYKNLVKKVKYEIVFVFDAFDESHLIDTFSDKKIIDANFIDFIKNEKSKIIITSKPWYIDYLNCDELEVVVLREFDDAQINNYVRKHFDSDREKIHKFFIFIQKKDLIELRGILWFCLWYASW